MPKILDVYKTLRTLELSIMANATLHAVENPRNRVPKADFRRFASAPITRMFNSLQLARQAAHRMALSFELEPTEDKDIELLTFEDLEQTPINVIIAIFEGDTALAELHKGVCLSTEKYLAAGEANADIKGKVVYAPYVDSLVRNLTDMVMVYRLYADKVLNTLY